MRVFVSSLIALLGVAVALAVVYGRSEVVVVQISGHTMATSYELVYVGQGADSVAIRSDVDDLLSLQVGYFSTYDSSTTISQINASRDTSISHLVSQDFHDLFLASQDVFNHSNGLFNPAVGAYTLAWGISSGVESIPSEKRLERLKSASQMNQFQISDSEPWYLKKHDENAALDFNGIAKGYAVDKVVEYLLSRGLSQFLVELGGEIRTVGNHPDGRSWQVAIEYPSAAVDRVQAVLSISDIAIATSGNYRTVRYQEGIPIVHTIQPRTGVPESNDLMSVTVIAVDCTTADAYATALMVMGSNDAISFLSTRPDLEAYLTIGETDLGQDNTNGPYSDIEVYITPGFQARITATN